MEIDLVLTVKTCLSKNWLSDSVIEIWTISGIDLDPRYESFLVVGTHLVEVHRGCLHHLLSKRYVLRQWQLMIFWLHQEGTVVQITWL
jgi:hypothetical protein